jgi:hypothetical protein
VGPTARIKTVSPDPELIENPEVIELEPVPTFALVDRFERRGVWASAIAADVIAKATQVKRRGTEMGVILWGVGLKAFIISWGTPGSGQGGLELYFAAAVDGVLGIALNDCNERMCRG